VLGGIAQVAGAVGVLLCLLLAVVGFVARRRAIDRVDAVAQRIDDGIAKGGPLLGAARDRTDGLRSQVSSLGDAVRARAAEPGAASEQVQALLERATDVSDRYLELRTTYADAREKSLSVLDRLSALDEVVPAVSIPQGPADALAALDERLRALDADILGLIGAIPEAGSRLVADVIAEKVDRTETALQAVSDRLVQTGTRLDGLRREVAERVDRVRTLLTVAAVVWMLAWLYGALLHFVLFRSGRRARRGAAGGAGEGT
jgi:chromosome segregation ATPase